MGSIFLSIMGSFLAYRSSFHLSLIYTGITTSIMVLAGRAAVFTSLHMQTAFMAMSRSYNFLFTFLVCMQLFMARRRMRNILGKEKLIPYASFTATLVESTSLYLIVELIYHFAFAFHNHVPNLLIMENAIFPGYITTTNYLINFQSRASSEPITF
ncbi:hypothetical protein BDQ17DRAFT_267853 [Cyathus striatus]|nr:hypothetical protein BDQ17DRAFT_267853 [Cyathus striatus]